MADTRWKPNVTVAAVVEHDGRYLMVEEASPDGPVLNQPAGHLDPGETLIQAVVREVLEETAHPFTPTHLIGVYLAPSPRRDVTYLRFAFGGTVGAPVPGCTLDVGILRAFWLTPAQVEAAQARHRSALVAMCIADHRAGRRHALDLLHSLPLPPAPG